MKKYWGLCGVAVAMAVLVWAVSPRPSEAVSGVAQADAPGANLMATILRSNQTPGTRDYLSVAGAGTMIYGLSVACADANCWCDLYDSATIPTSTVGSTRFASTLTEIKEDTDEEEAVKFFARPIRVTTALSISLNNGLCTVYIGS